MCNNVTKFEKKWLSLEKRGRIDNTFHLFLSLSVRRSVSCWLVPTEWESQLNQQQKAMMRTTTTGDHVQLLWCQRKVHACTPLISPLLSASASCQDAAGGSENRPHTASCTRGPNAREIKGRRYALTKKKKKVGLEKNVVSSTSLPNYRKVKGDGHFLLFFFLKEKLFVCLDTYKSTPKKCPQIYKRHWCTSNLRGRCFEKISTWPSAGTCLS